MASFCSGPRTAATQQVVLLVGKTCPPNDLNNRQAFKKVNHHAQQAFQAGLQKGQIIMARRFRRKNAFLLYFCSSEQAGSKSTPRRACKKYPVSVKQIFIRRSDCVGPTSSHSLTPKKVDPILKLSNNYKYANYACMHDACFFQFFLGKHLRPTIITVPDNKTGFSTLWQAFSPGGVKKYHLLSQ